ncbi:unnamed protein product [Meloidogyne enterolobii]|uniref:Uncharacterized protein n=1 Tax=Meloidogyne enterolobii TaxID=390850 RepID=A0ACB1A7Y6_MELEN
MSHSSPNILLGFFCSLSPNNLLTVGELALNSCRSILASLNILIAFLHLSIASFSLLGHHFFSLLGHHYIYL